MCDGAEQERTIMGHTSGHTYFGADGSMPSASADGSSAGAGVLDEQAIAAQFPLVAAGRQAKKPLVYLDNAATTHKPECVLSALEYYYRCANANTDRGVYSLAKLSTQLYEKARHMSAQFVGVADDEVIFTSGATAALNLVASTYGMAHLRPGDEIALSLAEHHSNLLPWQHIARLTQAKLVYLLPNEEGNLSDDEIDAKIGSQTKIVAIAHVSNVLGSVFPVRRIADAAHAVGAAAVVDCAQSVAHLPVDFETLGADFLAFSGHKMFGPMGIGVLCGRRELLADMAPFMRGGGMIDNVFENWADFAEPPTRFEAGTPNIAGAVGLAEAMQFISDTGYDALRTHETRLLARLIDGLEALPFVRLYGAHGVDSGERCGVVSFNIPGVDANDAATVLALDNIAIRSGAHCAEPLMRFLREQATCRASLALYNDESDVDRFLESVEHVRLNVMRIMTTGGTL